MTFLKFETMVNIDIFQKINYNKSFPRLYKPFTLLIPKSPKSSINYLYSTQSPKIFEEYLPISTQQ